MAKHGRAASNSAGPAAGGKTKDTPRGSSGHKVTKDQPARAIGRGKPRARSVASRDQDDYVRLANDTVEVLLARKFGPRIVRYGFLGGENVLGEVPDLVTQTTLGSWRPRAGHRLWTSPEQMPRSYAPDNEPVDVQVSGTTVTLTQSIEAATGVQKVMTVTLAAAGTEVIVGHRLVNHNIWSIEVAPWALTIMRPGGTVILPQEPFISHAEQLLPVRAMALWGFTDLTDRRWHIGPRFVRLRNDAALAAPQKVGVANRQGWSAYLCDGELFVKRYAWDESARYPDFGVNTETFTAGNLIELETLGGLVSLAPGASTSHDERWFLFRGVTLPAGDDELAREMGKHVRATHTG